jgi:signal peptidase I
MRSRRRSASVLAIAVLLGIGIALAVNRLGVHASRVLSSSMSPTIHRGDWIVTRDVDGADRKSIDRRDIVLFRFPLGTAGRAVKRVVAVAGDRVAISRYRVVVDGRVIPTAGAPSDDAARRRVETVPPGHVFLLGDNSPVSIDSRSLGPLPETEIVGRVVGIVHRRTLLRVIVIAGSVAVIVVGLGLVRRGGRGLK